MLSCSVTEFKKVNAVKNNTKIASVKIVVSSADPANLETVLNVFEKWYGPVSTIVAPKEIESKAYDKKMEMKEVQQSAINRMIACTAEMTEITQQEFAIAIGIEKVIDAGQEHWVVAVRFYKGGCYFDYVTSTLSDKKCKELKEVCFAAFQRLGNITFHDTVNQKFDTVLIFGTFDLFHELHKKLLDAAAILGKEVIVYVNEDTAKFKRAATTGNSIQESKSSIIDSPGKRRRNVAIYLGLRGEVKLKQGKHIEQLNQAIKQCYSKGKTVALFGGNDQFENFPKILDLCYQTKTPIITQKRGETDTLLCTTDLKAKMEYSQIANSYMLDLDNLNSSFFKKRIESKEAAIKYLLKLTDTKKITIPDDKVLGLTEAEVWQYHYLDKTVKRLTDGHKNTNKILLCLPGRSPCDVGRARKILHTLHNQLVPVSLRQLMTCFIACYKQEDKTTETNLKSLKDNPCGFFSEDAMITTRLLILPRINGQKSLAGVKAALAGITIWARSYGSVIAIEMENAFRYLMQSLGYKSQEIIEAGKEICVISISNLAPLERPRLFTTLSVTGFNDSQAAKYIVDFPDLVKKYYRSEEMLSQNFISATHNAVMVDIPEKFTELSTGRIIKDPKRHYTPNYDSIRKQMPGQPPVNNAGPILIHKELELMIQRANTFDLHQTECLDFKLESFRKCPI